MINFGDHLRGCATTPATIEMSRGELLPGASITIPLDNPTLGARM